MKNSDFPVVIVEWLDACGVSDDWEDADKMESLFPAPSISIGFLTESNKQYVTIAQTITKDKKQVLGRGTIPAGSIIKKKKIKKLIWS